MRFSVLRVLSAFVLVAVAVVASACSHDELSGGSQNLNMTFSPVQGTLGTGRFEEASFIIKNLRALPADPAEARLYGPDKLLFRFTPFPDVDDPQQVLTLTAPVPFSNITLSEGSYVVTSVEISPLVLIDQNPTPDPIVCIRGFAKLQDGDPLELPDFFLLTNPQTFSFTIQPGQTTLALTVNVPGLIAGYEAAFTCSFEKCTGCPVDPKPTVTGFDQAMYRDALLRNISIK